MVNILPDPSDVLTVELLVAELRQNFRRKSFYGPADSEASIRFMEGQQSVLQWLEDRLSK
jgi:hypothetical protein